MEDELFVKDIDDIIYRRLIKVPNEVKFFFPKLLKNKVTWVIAYSDKYLAIHFISKKNLSRIEEYKKDGIPEFIGLFSDKPEEAAFRLNDNVRNTFVHKGQVSGKYSFHLKKDNTLIISEHSMKFNTGNFGELTYVVDLSFVVSYGDEIVKMNILDYIENLIAYYIKKNREDDNS